MDMSINKFNFLKFSDFKTIKITESRIKIHINLKRKIEKYRNTSVRWIKIFFIAKERKYLCRYLRISTQLRVIHGYPCHDKYLFIR